MPTSWRFNPWRRRPASQQPESSQYQQIILTHKYVVALFAFLVSVDLVEIVGVLCYQLFTASYFPWHLYPMMFNRAVELVAFICSRGYIPSLYSIAQISLSLLSISVYARRQPCSRYSCAAPLVLYCFLLSYQIFVAVMVVKVSRMPMADDEGHIIANWPTTQVAPVANAEDPHLRPLGIQIIGLSPRAMRARVINQVIPHERGSSQIARANSKPMLSDPTEIIFAVQQPDGEKVSTSKSLDLISTLLISTCSRTGLHLRTNLWWITVLMLKRSFKLAIARICKDVALETQPIGTSTSRTSAMQGQTLGSLLSRPMSPPLDTTINVLQLQSVVREGAGLVTVVTPTGEGVDLPTCSSHIAELDEIEIHEQPHAHSKVS